MDADFLLIKRMKQGDEDAFDVFIRRYYGDILRYCAYRCADTGCAEDLTQETFVRFFEKLSDYRHMGKAKNYLYKIVGSLFILSLAMLISAKTRSAVLAVTVPFIVLFIPSFLSGVNALNKVLGLLPDQLLQISSVINQFNLYELGGQVVGSVPILMVLYSCFCVIMIPWTYRICHRISER